MRFLLFALALLAVGCGGPRTGLAADLPGSTWTLERVVMADGTVQRGDGAEVTFSADGRVSLSSCNICNGRYSVRDGVLTLAEPLACTRRGCAPGAVELERLLGGTVTLRRDGVFLVAEPQAGAAAQVLFVPAEG